MSRGCARIGRAPARQRLRLAARPLGVACALALLPLGVRAEPAPARAPAAAGVPAGPEAPVKPAPGAAPVAAEDLHRRHREAVESFTAWDGDRDGYVAAPEAMEMTPESFEAADRDRDGKLSLVEWVDARFE